ncbi:RING/U-box [Rhizopus microsporus var. microsporus]|uniref:RING-type E3 ubiquitin transferase n=2 Tax=Rhizopus microsporus TaxID=58291 RepID=A0A2G4T0S3_RHIZD|nr:RING/U-box [Rhizopus microsporus ATCC 52813]ORE12029.1 RING/U-box [Rhizopus microsporus var. microsporus]PHZ14276.1 RING/U-box [Rhizopus microsporus ATCC 52813]
METNAETSSAENVNTNNISSQDTNESTTTSINTESKTAQELRNRKTKSTPTTPATQSKDETTNGGEFYDCNICFDTAMHPVLTLCGHLFCWSCLAQWLHAQSRNPTCPVCKAGCGKDKVIPIYGRGKEEIDFRTDPSIPTRPAGQRPPPLRDPNRPANYFFNQPFGSNTFHRGGMSISAGFGIIPFGVTFNIPAGTPHAQTTPQGAFISRLIMMLLSLLVIAIVFA